MDADAANELISVREAAKECNRNPETIRRWIWSGKLPAEKLGNQLFIKKSALTAYCQEIGQLETSTGTTDELTPESQTGSRLDVLTRLQQFRQVISHQSGNIDIDRSIEQTRGII